MVIEGGALVAGAGGFEVGADVVGRLRLAVVPAAAAADGAPAFGGAGDVTAESTDLLATLFDTHYRSLCRLAYVLLGDNGVAEDVVQEAFLRTFSGFARLRDKSRADAYLRRSVVNLCRSRLRRRSVEGRGASPFFAESCVDPPASRDPDLLAAVRALPPRQRAAVVLFYYADLPESEVAATLGCSIGTVKSQLAKARAALARCLGERSGEGTQ